MIPNEYKGFVAASLVVAFFLIYLWTRDQGGQAEVKTLDRAFFALGSTASVIGLAVSCFAFLQQALQPK